MNVSQLVYIAFSGFVECACVLICMVPGSEKLEERNVLTEGVFINVMCMVLCFHFRVHNSKSTYLNGNISLKLHLARNV